jgi:excisionase family DNA binding protein
VIPVSLELSDEVLDAIAERVLERLPARGAESPFVDVDEAAELLRCDDRQRIYDLCSAGKLTRYKEGSRLLLSRAEVVALPLPSGPRARSVRGLAA